MDIKYIHKTERGHTITPTSAVPIITPNVIKGLYSINITIDGTNQSLLITKGLLVAHIVLAEIVTWDLGDVTIIIITEDPTPLQLIFVNNTERDLALATLEAGMNL